MQGQRERRLRSSIGAVARLVVVMAVPLAVAVMPHVACAATIAIDSERHGDAIELRASVVLKADAATAWRVLTDYERYAEFIPDLHRSHVIARRGSMTTVEQSGHAVLWLFKMPLDVTFEVNEVAPGSLQSRAVAGSLRALTSTYALTPTSAGTRLDYSGRVEPGFALFGQLELTAVERNITRQFQALADEIERQGARARAPSGEGAR